MNARVTRFIGTSPLAALASCLALASTTTAEDSKLQADLEFARKLADRFAYVDIAEQVIAEVEAAGPTGKDVEALGLAKCDVYASGAKGEPRKEKRLELYDKAIQAFQNYLDANQYSDYVPIAQKNYVDLVKNYGAILEMELDDALGDDAVALRAKIKEVIDGGLDLTSNLIDLTEGAETQVEKNERWRLMLNRGQMLLTLANVSEDGTYFYGNAEKVLENLALEAGETSGPGLNAFLLLARVKMAQGKYQDAADFAGYVYDVVLPIEAAQKEAVGWGELTFEEKVPRWKLGEIGCSIVVDAYRELGRLDKASKYALAYYNTWKSEGFEISPLGSLSLLSCAKALEESGGFVGGQQTAGDLVWFATEEEMNAAGFRGNRNSRSALDLALSIAQNVNDDNKGSILQVRAQKVISTIIERPGLVVSPDILFEAAEGDYYAEDYERAIQGYKSILRQLDTRDEATKQEYAPKVLYGIGNALRKLDRNLEAAMAYREAATTWKGDPEYDEKVANGYYSMMGQLRTASGGDQLYQNMYLEAEKLLQSAGTGDNNTITFRQAERAYSEQDYVGARERYLKLEPGGSNYEKAVAKAALCLYKVQDIAGAKSEFENYLTVYVEDPRTKPVDAAGQRERSEAMAIAKFYMGRIAYNSDWPEVVRWLEGYEKEFPDQTDYAPNALYMLTKAYISLNQFADAKRTVEAMESAFGKHTRTGAAAIMVFQALSAEHDKAQAAGDTATATNLARQMAEYMHLSNSLDETPSYDNMRKESTLWIELEEWEAAEAVLQKMVTAFEGDASVDLDQYAIPDLGLVLLELGRIPEAHAVLDPLIPKTDDDERRVAGRVLERWCRSVTGWVTGDENTIEEVAGVGGAADLEVAAGLLRKLTDSEGVKAETGKYSCEWYELKFETAYAYYQWGKEDSAQTNNAFILIENLQAILSSNRLDDVKDKCGGPVLQKRFLWLLDKVK